MSAPRKPGNDEYHGRLISSPSTTMTSVLSEFSEDSSDSETFVPIMTCIEDDKEFIRNAKARTMANDAKRMIKGGKRVASLWEALRHLPSSLRQQVLLDLLQGSDDREDIWLWNEGDEALMEWDEDWTHSPPPWQSAAMALERRLAQTPVQTPRRREVQRAAFGMRVAMIVWMALASAAYKSADKERGVRDREEWDMLGLIENWYFSLPSGVQRWLAQHSESYDDQAFTEVMDQAGHSFYKGTREQDVRWWLFMRSQLSPTQQDHIIYLGGDHCAPCLVHKPTHESESLPSWIPEPALVALRDMWDNIESHYDERRDFSKWLLHHSIDGFKEASECLRSLPRDNDENEYLSWVNPYPSDLCHTVTKYTLEEWQAMDNCIQPSERGESLNIRSWCAAMHWNMMLRGLSYHTRAKQFIDAWRYSVHWRLDFLPSPTPAQEFRDTIRDSGHTCWKEWEMDDYVAAMTFLDEDPEVVGIDVRKDSRCQVCHLQWRMRNLGETLPVEERAFEADMTELLVMLGNECSRRNVSWNTILASVQHRDVDGSVPNSDHQEQQVLHYTPANGDEQGHDMRTGPVDLNVPHRPQPQIPRAVYLPEDITHIIPPNTNISYVQHGSIGLQRVNSGTSMANPIINGIQDQGGETQYLAFHNIQPSSYTNLMDVDYTAYGQTWAPTSGSRERDANIASQRVVEHSNINTTHPPIGMIDQRASVRQIGGLGDYVPTEASAVTYPTRNPARCQVPSAINIEQDGGFTSRNTPPISSQYSRSHASSVAAVRLALPSKRQMADEIKKHLTDEMGKSFFWLVHVGISLAQTDKGQVKLPWLDFETTLGENRVRVINWPAGVARPGKDTSKDTSKGIYGVRLDSLTKIYRAIRDSTAPIQLLREETVLPNGLYTMSGDPETSVSRKRPRDSGDDEHEMSQPERGGKRMYFGS
ncbi:hypothetical protein C8J56DRAFT_1085262 [Mycena floridula]|nr:hypothetical protein C8J56DRAFT_1085262 [Mycena floridula]